jgi:hypothetical protein
MTYNWNIAPSVVKHPYHKSTICKHESLRDKNVMDGNIAYGPVFKNNLYVM